jgi:hypothetical protein
MTFSLQQMIFEDGSSSSSKQISIFIGPNNLNAVFTHAYHWTISLVRWILFIFWHTIPLRSTAISFQSHLDVTNDHFLSSLLANTAYAFVISKTSNKLFDYTNILLCNVQLQIKLALLYYKTTIAVTNTIRNTDQCLLPFITMVKLWVFLL